jgi:hypothetical protein
VAADLEAVCLKCLEKRPALRYPSAAELADDLGRWLAGQPVRARPRGPLALAWRWVRSHEVAVTLFATAVALSVAFWFADGYLLTYQRIRAVNAPPALLRLFLPLAFLAGAAVVGGVAVTLAYPIRGYLLRLRDRPLLMMALAAIWAVAVLFGVVFGIGSIQPWPAPPAQTIPSKEYAKVCNSFARQLSTCPESRVRDGKRAVYYATEACQATRWKHADYLDTLAAAYAEMGDYKEAVKWQQQALALGWGDEAETARAERRLELYRGGKPYRER